MRLRSKSRTVQPSLFGAQESQFQVASANVVLLRRAWVISFSLAAVLQIAVWPEWDNIACVMLAWFASMVTSLVVLRGRVTVFFPWSSLLLLMFCLQNISLPLVLLIFQGNAITANLKVPVWTFFHLCCCQLVFLGTHWVYRHLWLGQMARFGVQNKVLKPLGIFTRIEPWKLWGMGLVGFASAVYIYVFVRAEQGGALMVTGSVWQRVANGFIPFAFAPFLFLLPGQAIGIVGKNHWVSRALLGIYFIIILLLAMAFNCRSIMFIGVAMAGVVALLLVLVGNIRLVLKRIFWIGLVGLILIATVGSDFSLAMRLVRDDRANKSAVELIQETFTILTLERERLHASKADLATGQDTAEAWYITSPMFSRLVNTHFQDRALAVGQELGAGNTSILWTTEGEQLLCTLPDPMVKLLDPNMNKDLIKSSCIGDWLLVMGGDEYAMGGFNTGGFIGDGFALFGWFYFLPMAFIVLLFFILSDAFYLVAFTNLPSANQNIGVFALVALINGYALATSLSIESISGLFAFLLRQPVQWLTLFGILMLFFKLVRFKIQTSAQAVCLTRRTR